MKGQSPVARLQQAEIEIATWLRDHLSDSTGAVAVVLHRAAKGSELLLNNPDQPLVVLAAICQRILESDKLLKELVRQADVMWGTMMGERPYLEKQGLPPDPNDPYTAESVRIASADVVKQLAADER